MAEHTIEEKKMHCKHWFPCNTLTHSINEDLLNIKRKGDPEVSYPLLYVRYHWNPEPVCNKSHLFFNLFNLFWHTDKNFCFYAEVNFWDFVRNDNSNKGTTAWLNETRFGPKNKSSPIYLGPKKSRHFLMHWMSVKLPDNFQMCEHSWPCRFHINVKIKWCTEHQISCVFAFFTQWKRVKTHVLSDQSVHLRIHIAV
jgi:hypothetical protein